MPRAVVASIGSASINGVVLGGQWGTTLDDIEEFLTGADDTPRPASRIKVVDLTTRPDGTPLPAYHIEEAAR